MFVISAAVTAFGVTVMTVVMRRRISDNFGGVVTHTNTEGGVTMCYSAVMTVSPDFVAISVVEMLVWGVFGGVVVKVVVLVDGGGFHDGGLLKIGRLS